MRSLPAQGLVVCLCLSALVSGCDGAREQAKPSASPSAAVDPEDQIRRNSAAVLAAWNGGSLDEFVGYFDDAITLQSPGAPAAIGIGAVRSAYEPIFEDKRPTMVETIDTFEFSGELAVTTGRWSSKVGTDYDNHTLTVWKRQADGEWKILRWIYAQAQG